MRPIMTGQEFQAGPVRILYDPSRVTAVSVDWADPEFWRLRKAVVAELGGRGQALQIETPAGPAVLRRYLRGGWVAKFVHESYVFIGYRHSRSFREFRVLSELHHRGLPVPAPILASCERAGGAYRAALMTSLVAHSRSLGKVSGELGDSDWRQLGATLHRFFQAGLVHPDLNANNILLDAAGKWHLIDFDRASIRGRPVDGRPMLKRLARSCRKFGIELPPDLN